jgi:hypothetical protein
VLNEFLYDDVIRVRSLLAQLDRGIVETVVEKRGESATTDLGATLLGLKGEHVSERTKAAEESRSVQDLLFTVFEEIVANGGLLRDVAPEEIDDPAGWESSEVHRSLTEGELIKLFLSGPQAH